MGPEILAKPVVLNQGYFIYVLSFLFYFHLTLVILIIIFYLSFYLRQVNNNNNSIKTLEMVGFH